MMFALIALVQSAFACGPYGAFTASDNGALAFEDGDSISLYTADGTYAQLPIFGELVDMDFVGEELVVSYLEDKDSFAVLYDETGEEVADWMPRREGLLIQDIHVLKEGLLVVGKLDGKTTRIRLSDDLEPNIRQATTPTFGRTPSGR